MIGLALGAALLTFTALIATSCDRGGDSRVPPEDAYIIDKNELPQVLANSAPGERQFLEDGVLTFAEMEQAVLNVVACGKQKGLDFGDGPTLSKRWRYYFHATWKPDAAGPGALDDCRHDYYWEIQRLWTIQTAASPQEFHEARVALGKCFRKQGFDVPEDPDSNALLAIATKSSSTPGWAACTARIADEFALPGFVG